MIEPHENTMTSEELRREVRALWNEGIAFENDLKNLPVIPSVETMRHLSAAAMSMKWPDIWSIGKRLQREHAGVPGKTEYECATGMWSIIRAALMEAETEKEHGTNAAD